jgi:hypothetical protein
MFLKAPLMTTRMKEQRQNGKDILRKKHKGIK